MMPDMDAFTEELFLIKTARIFKNDVDAKETLKNIGFGALGLGLGLGASYLVGRKVLPHLTPALTQRQRDVSSMVVGGLGGLIAARKLSPGSTKK